MLNLSLRTVSAATRSLVGQAKVGRHLGPVATLATSKQELPVIPVMTVCPPLKPGEIYFVHGTTLLDAKNISTKGIDDELYVTPLDEIVPATINPPEGVVFGGFRSPTCYALNAAGNGGIPAIVVLVATKERLHINEERFWGPWYLSWHDNPYLKMCVLNHETLAPMALPDVGRKTRMTDTTYGIIPQGIFAISAMAYFFTHF